MKHDYDGPAGVVKVLQICVLVWAWAMTMTVVVFFGCKLWGAAWDYIARFNWARLP